MDAFPPSPVTGCKDEPSRAERRAESLPESLQAMFERLFEADLSAIRLVCVPELQGTRLGAAASGDLILLGPESPDLRSAEGAALLGHEVAHCLQQRSWGAAAEGGAGALEIADPLLEEAADWAASLVGRQASVPRSVRDAGVGWRPGPSTRLSRADCALTLGLARRGIRLPGAHLQARIAGGVTYYGGDVRNCPACSGLTVGTAHELASSLLTIQLCGQLLTNLRDLSAKAETERTGSASSRFGRSRFSSLSEAMSALDETSQGYMTGVLDTTTGQQYGACSGPAESIPESFDTAIAMTNLRGCQDDLDPDRLRTRGGRRLDPALVYAAPNSNPPGNCAAPKLIQQCYSDGLIPRNMVEMFYGQNSPANGQVIESCDTCKNLLPPMLCPSV